MINDPKNNRPAVVHQKDGDLEWKQQKSFNDINTVIAVYVPVKDPNVLLNNFDIDVYSIDNEYLGSLSKYNDYALVYYLNDAFVFDNKGDYFGIILKTKIKKVDSVAYDNFDWEEFNSITKLTADNIYACTDALSLVIRNIGFLDKNENVINFKDDSRYREVKQLIDGVHVTRARILNIEKDFDSFQSGIRMPIGSVVVTGEVNNESNIPAKVPFQILKFVLTLHNANNSHISNVVMMTDKDDTEIRCNFIDATHVDCSGNMIFEEGKLNVSFFADVNLDAKTHAYVNFETFEIPMAYSSKIIAPLWWSDGYSIFEDY